MSGGASVPFAIAAVFAGEKYQQILLWAAAVFCLTLAGYRVWAAERRKVIELNARITPNFRISFDSLNRGLELAIDRITHHTGLGGIAATAVTQHQAKYLRICVAASTNAPVRNCQAFIFSLEKRLNEKEQFKPVHLPQFISLRDQPFDVLPRLPEQVDFLKVTDFDNKMTRTGYWPFVLEDVFNDLGIYRFGFKVNGDGVTSNPIHVDVHWRGAWNTISASLVFVEPE